MTSRFRLCAASLALAAAFSAAAFSVGVGDMDASRYDVILRKEPFGPPPKTGPTPEELAEQERQAALQAAAQQAVEEAYVIPPGLDKVKITLLSRFCGVPSVGFVDGESGKEYYLQEGQEFDGFSCLAIDLLASTATLSKGGREAELPLWINPVTTNRADVTTFGQPGGAAVDLSLVQTKTDWELEKERSAQRRELDERRERRRKQREEWEERRRQHAEEMAALTPEQRERRMHDINLDIIMNNSGPPLPIELDEEDERRLEEAGFEIPRPGGGEEAEPGRGRRRRFGVPGEARRGRARSGEEE